MVDGYAYCRIQTDVNGEPEDFIILEVNPALQKIIGISSEKLVSKKVSQIFPDIKKGEYNWIKRLGQVVITEKEQVFAHYSEKYKKWFQIRAFCPERGHLATIIADITGRQQAEENLQKSVEELKTKLAEKESEIKKIDSLYKETESKYENMINAFPILIYKSNPDSLQAIYVNKAIEDLYGYSREEWVSNPDLWAKSIHPDDRDRVLRNFEEARSNKQNNSIQYKIIRKDNQEKYINDSFFWELDQNGNPISLQGYIQEIKPEQIVQQNIPSPDQKIETSPPKSENILLIREQIEEYKKREGKLRILTSNLADIFWEWNILDGSINWFGKTHETLCLYLE